MSEDNYSGIPIVVDDRLPGGFIGLFARRQRAGQSQDYLQGVWSPLPPSSDSEPLRITASHLGAERAVPRIVPNGQQ